MDGFMISVELSRVYDITRAKEGYGSDFPSRRKQVNGIE